jgi:hypothetical protein
MSGIGRFAYCRWDHVKHNLVFSSLIDQHLPILLQDADRGEIILHYGFAFYILPVRLAALLESAAGGVDLDVLLVILYAAAAILSVRVISAFGAVPALVLLAVLIVVGGFDPIGLVLYGKPPPMMAVPDLPFELVRSFEWWGTPLAPQSLTHQLFWAPQHVFGALVGVALLMAVLRLEGRAATRLLLAGGIIAAGALWSPYVAVGLTAFALAEILVGDPGAVLCQLRSERLLSPGAPAAAAYGVVLAAFAILFYDAARPLSPPRWIFETASVSSWLLTFLLNLAPFMLVLLMLAVPWRGAALSLRTDSAARIGVGLLGTALLLLFAHGHYNDWAMRTTLPLLIGMAVAAARLLAGRIGWPRRLLVIAILGLSGASSGAEIMLSIFVPENCPAYGSVRPADLGELTFQYEGRPDSFLYRHLARR